MCVIDDGLPEKQPCKCCSRWHTQYRRGALADHPGLLPHVYHSMRIGLAMLECVIVAVERVHAPSCAWMMLRNSIRYSANHAISPSHQVILPWS